VLAVIRQRNFGLFWVSGLVSGIGDFALLAALPYYVYATSHSTLASGISFASEMLPSLVFSNLGGVYADRWKRKPVIVGSEWLRGIVLLPLLAVHGSSTIWIVFAVGFGRSAIGNFAGPFGGSAIPQVVSREELPSANGAFSAASNIAVLVGSPIGGVLLGRLGLSAVTVADSASYFLAGILVLLVRADFGGANGRSGDTARTSAWKDWTQALKLIRHVRWLLTFFTVISLLFLANGIAATLLAPFVRLNLHGTAQFFALTVTAQGIGGILAAMLLGRIAGTVSSVVLLSWSLMAFGFVDALIAIVARQSFTVVGAFLAGVFALFGIASLNTLLQSEVSRSFLGRILGVYAAASALASIMGSIVGGSLAPAVGVRVMFGIAGPLFVLAGLLSITVLNPRLVKRNDLAAVRPSG
jgi:predicted MFS family arabinose efflux permease